MTFIVENTYKNKGELFTFLHQQFYSYLILLIRSTFSGKKNLYYIVKEFANKAEEIQ